MVSGQSKITQLLLDHGAEADHIATKSCYGLPLQEAVGRGHDEIVAQMLPKCGLESLDNGVKAAAGKGKWSLCQEFLHGGASINNVIRHAVKSDLTDMIETILDQKANVDATELEVAHSHDALVLVQSPGTRGIVESRSTYQYGNSLLAVAALAKLPIASLLIDLNVKADAHGKKGFALAAAATSGHHDMVTMLLDQGANPNLKGGNGPALYCASSVGHLGIVQELLDRHSSLAWCQYQHAMWDSKDTNPSGSIYGSSSHCTIPDGARRGH